LDILIPIETSSRELYYKIQLCHELALAGFNCYLGNKSSILYLVDHFNSFIYLDKGYHQDISDSIYQKIKQRNGYIVNLDEEGGVDYPDNSTILRRYPKHLFNTIDLVFLWGETQFKLLHPNFSKAKVLITGHPRFELLRKTKGSIYNSEVNVIKKQFNNFFLINTNFGFGNNIRGDIFVNKNYSNRFPNIEEKINFDKLKLNTFISLILKISSLYKYKLIIRPHPEENIENYRKAFKGISNIYILNKFSVIPWLIATRLMIHPDCTTAIESLILGKKSVSFLPSNYNSNLVTKLPLEASYTFSDELKLINFLNSFAYPEPGSSCEFDDIDLSDYNFLESNFSLTSNSSEIIKDVLSKLFKNDKFNTFTTLNRINLGMANFNTAIMPGGSKKLFYNKLQGFSFKNITEIDKTLMKIYCTKEILVNKLSKYLFLFTRRL